MPLLNRRQLLRNTSFLAAATALPQHLFAQQLTTLDIACAGAFRPIADGPLKTPAATALHLDLHTHAQGADAVAHALIDGTLHADLFVPITPGPMHTVLQAGLAPTAYPIARTEMVLVYSPKSRYASMFDAAAAGKANWWQVLQQPGINFAHGNPAGDPGGRNAFFLLMLAAKKYGNPELVDKLLGPALSTPPPAAGASNQDKLHSGELDVASSYRVATSFGDLPYIVLPKDINLSGDTVAAEHPEISLSINGSTFRPEPLVFYAAVLKNAANPSGATAFVEWLKSDAAQTLLQKYQYASPSTAAVLRA